MATGMAGSLAQRCEALRPAVATGGRSEGPRVSEIEVRPLTPTIGAEIEGIDLREPLASEAVAAVKRALLDHLVIFFRGQDLDAEQQKTFARHFGRIGVPPFAPIYGSDPEVTVL